MIKEIKSTREVGCAICNNPALAKQVNERLIKAEMTSEGIAQYLEDEFGLHITEKDIEKHKGHLFTVLESDADRDEKVDELVEQISASANIDLINKEIAELKFFERQLIEAKKEDTPQFQKNSSSLQKLIELRVRIAGEDTVVVKHELPKWISLIKEGEKDG